MAIKRIIKEILLRLLSKREPFVAYKKESWSQSGEDIIIEYLFGLRKIENPSCLDIGAYHPMIANNTFKFFRKGSKVVNIDANPAAIEMFIQYRPNDINLNIGIGAQNGSFDFYIMEDAALNTFSEAEKESLEKLGSKLKEVKKIAMLQVNEVLEKYFASKAPDLISIDAEGVDIDIIRSFDFSKYSPKVFCIETINYTPDGTGSRRIDLCDMIEAAGYFEYANSNINSIYVNKAWWFAGK